MISSGTRAALELEQTGNFQVTLAPRKSDHVPEESGGGNLQFPTMGDVSQEKRMGGRVTLSWNHLHGDQELCSWLV